jgi:hypothetical protein
MTQTSFITEDVLSLRFRDYLKNSMHNAYKFNDETMIQVNAKVNFVNQKIDMRCIFCVILRTLVSNDKIDIILDKSFCLDLMVIHVDFSLILEIERKKCKRKRMKKYYNSETRWSLRKISELDVNYSICMFRCFSSINLHSFQRIFANLISFLFISDLLRHRDTSTISAENLVE